MWPTKPKYLPSGPNHNLEDWRIYFEVAPVNEIS